MGVSKDVILQSQASHDYLRHSLFQQRDSDMYSNIKKLRSTEYSQYTSKIPSLSSKAPYKRRADLSMTQHVVTQQTAHSIALTDDGFASLQ